MSRRVIIKEFGGSEKLELSDLILGVPNENLPSLTLGYIYLPALFGITITSIISAKYGADIAHYVSENILKKLMVSLMLLISIYMFAIW